ncbi:DNA/RNA nuclease SfsA [Calditerricola satsumensis]|uniref:Sugar fermentation stimulation protein homolog n=1 Tax=Calditerricola satsumensis TaxID=373054 RepID=A0A8J3B6N3_9BACI|nr:DNA/RNA nuclease SfsA [Calditerricola satsumensis]GGJ97695.1 sugar fermentation stimulation protein [Calditerricola satsumensis]
MDLRFAELVPATFVRRLNRFVAEVDRDGERMPVHVPSTGRLDTVLVPGRSCFLRPGKGRARRYPYSLFLVRAPESWVCIDALVANAVAEALLVAGRVPGVPAGDVRREVAWCGHRVDFAVSAEGRLHLIEVKSVNLAVARLALFPDAPTERGTRHLRALQEAQQRDAAQAHVLFVVQRADADAFAPHEAVDPAFAQALRALAAAGANVQAVRTRVSPLGLSVAEWLPVRL